MIGLEFRERMAGTWHRLDAPTDERPFAFTVRVTVGRLVQLLGGAVATLDGHVDADGLARGAPLAGTLDLGALVRTRELPYRFRFTGDDGTSYRFDGHKTVDLMDLPRTMTILPGSIYADAGHEIGRAVLQFDLRGDLVTFLRSWRPVLRRARV